MPYLVVGGHTRSIGKTSLVVDLIGAMPEAGWTAVKITQFGHGVCSEHGEPCDCASATHAAVLDEETDRSGRTDSSRFLVAGAAERSGGGSDKADRAWPRLPVIALYRREEEERGPFVPKGGQAWLRHGARGSG